MGHEGVLGGGRKGSCIPLSVRNAGNSRLFINSGSVSFPVTRRGVAGSAAFPALRENTGYSCFFGGKTEQVNGVFFLFF